MMRIKIVSILFIVMLFPALKTALAVKKPVRPFESYSKLEEKNQIDTLVMARLDKSGIPPANLCSDQIFMRRVFLDVIGTLPEPMEIRRFVNDTRKNKRQTLIEVVLRRKEFADYWSLKWCDLLRVKAEFPINLWPNAVQAYHRWIHDCFRDNMSYDQFVRELLTSSGSNFRVPQVNFYRAIQGKEPSTITAAVALTFMGERIDKWPEKKREGMEKFFSRVGYKGTAEWKEEIIFLDPNSTETLKAVFPNGRSVSISTEKDPRVVFADWLISEDNEWFARNIVNRIWAWTMGRGIIHEPDDIRKDNPASNPELLAYLEKELVKSGYDLKHIYRIILNSRTYQQSSIPQSDKPDAEKLFAYYPVRRLDAEILIDALNWISGGRENYSSAIPEPFTFIPQENRTIELADGSISSPFLEMFGRPSRDTGYISERINQPTDAQRMHMLNSTNVQDKIDNSWRLRTILSTAKNDKRELVTSIYLMVLSRYPTQDEQKLVEVYFKDNTISLKQGASDLAWALINSKEFLYRH